MPRGGTWGTVGDGESKFFFSEIKPDLVCELLYLHEWHMHRHNFLGPPPPRALGRGQKFNFLNMVMWHIKF